MDPLILQIVTVARRAISVGHDPATALSLASELFFAIAPTPSATPTPIGAPVLNQAPSLAGQAQALVGRLNQAPIVLSAVTATKPTV